MFHPYFPETVVLSEHRNLLHDAERLSRTLNGHPLPRRQRRRAERDRS